MALTILIVWLPTGFQTAGIQEEWRIRAIFDGNITTHNDIGKDTADEIFYTRPVIGALNQIAYWLSPDSFMSHHLILMGLLLAKGYVLFLLMGRLLPDFPLWGYICSLLLIFYPSDPAIVSLRVIHTHLAIVFILLSIYFLLRYFQQSERRFLLLMWICQALAGFTIEIGYPIFFFTPVLLIILEKHITKRVIITTILFYIVPAITFAYSIVLILVVSVSWQSTAIVSYTIREYLRTIFDLYQYNFITTWEDTVRYFATQANNGDYFVFVGTVIVSLIGGLAVTRLHKPLSIDRRFVVKLSLMIIGGGVAVLLGYAMFLASRTHVLTHYRVYLLSSVGTAIVIGSILYGLFHSLSQYSIKYLVLVGFSVIVGLSSVTANKFHHDYWKISEQQESIVRQVVDVVPALNEQAYIVIKTESNAILSNIQLGELQKTVLITPMFQYIYNDYEYIQTVVLCFTDYMTCIFESDSMDIQASNFLGFNLPIDYNQVILFDISRQGEITFIEQDESMIRYDPTRLIAVDESQPTRIQSIYGDSE